MTKDDLIKALTTSGAPTESDRKEFKSLLVNNPSLQRVMFMILAESDGMLGALANLDLTTDVGVKKAIQAQARCQMFSQFVEMLVDFALKETEPTKEKQDAN